MYTSSPGTRGLDGQGYQVDQVHQQLEAEELEPCAGGGWSGMLPLSAGHGVQMPSMPMDMDMSMYNMSMSCISCAMLP